MIARRNLIGDDGVFVVYRLRELDVTVTFTRGCQTEHVVELALGSEARKFPLTEFVNFWLSMVELGRKADGENLDSIEGYRMIPRGKS